jgi:hypothetical protein
MMVIKVSSGPIKRTSHCDVAFTATCNYAIVQYDVIGVTIQGVTCYFDVKNSCLLWKVDSGAPVFSSALAVFGSINCMFSSLQLCGG